VAVGYFWWEIIIKKVYFNRIESTAGVFIAEKINRELLNSVI
jgi:hypothetical protein